MIILKIDTSSNTEIKVALNIDGKEKAITQKIGTKKAQAVLPLINKFLVRRKVAVSDIDGIEVNTGPGSFTGIRVGISIANALGFALKIPINKEKAGALVNPVYK